MIFAFDSAEKSPHPINSDKIMIAYQGILHTYCQSYNLSMYQQHKRSW